MDKIIDGIVIVIAAALVAFGGQYTISQVYNWSRRVALEKAAQGLGRLEPATQKLTGGKLDF